MILCWCAIECCTNFLRQQDNLWLRFSRECVEETPVEPRRIPWSDSLVVDNRVQKHDTQGKHHTTRKRKSRKTQQRQPGQVSPIILSNSPADFQHLSERLVFYFLQQSIGTNTLWPTLQFQLVFIHNQTFNLVFGLLDPMHHEPAPQDFFRFCLPYPCTKSKISTL